MTSLKLGCEYFINFWTKTSWHILLGCQEAHPKKPFLDCYFWSVNMNILGVDIMGQDS